MQQFTIHNTNHYKNAQQMMSLYFVGYFPLRDTFWLREQASRCFDKLCALRIHWFIIERLQRWEVTTYTLHAQKKPLMQISSGNFIKNQIYKMILFLKDVFFHPQAKFFLIVKLWIGYFSVCHACIIVCIISYRLRYTQVCTGTHDV